MRQQQDVPVAAVDSALPGKLLDAADAGVCVLYVVDGVLPGLLRCQVEVELHLAVWGAGQEEEAAGIRADLVHELLQRHQVAGACGQPDRLSAASQRDELVEEQVEAVLADAQCGHHGLHERHVSLVVCAPDVYDAIEAARHQLVVVVCHVRGEVGRRLVARLVVSLWVILIL